MSISSVRLYTDAEMKTILSLSFLAIGVAGFASATTITVLCPTSGGFGVSGTSTSTCNTAAGPVGALSLDSIVLTFKFDADFGLGSGSVNESFDVNPPGTGDAFGGAFDHPTNQIVTDTARGIVGTFTILSPTQTEVNAALAGLSVVDTWTSGTGSFNNAAFDYQVDVNYTPGRSTVPEPATLSLMGGALIGLGFLARKPSLRSF
jgi:hypothetical protein